MGTHLTAGTQTFRIDTLLSSGLLSLIQMRMIVGPLISFVNFEREPSWCSHNSENLRSELGLGTSAAKVLVLAAPPCTAGT